MNYNFDLSTSPLVMREDPLQPGAFYRVANPWFDEFPELRTIDDYMEKVLPEGEAEFFIRSKVGSGELPVGKTTRKVPHPDYAFVESAFIDRCICTRKSWNEAYVDAIVEADIEISQRVTFYDGGASGLHGSRIERDHVTQQYRWSCMLTLNKDGLTFRTGKIELFEGSRPKRGMPLSKYLAPMMKRDDPPGERKLLLKTYFRDINKRQQCVRATELAGRMATVRYARLSKDRHIQGLSYPFACRVEVFDDRGNKVPMDVEPNTILIDKATCDYDPAKIEEAISHELSHLFEHRLFFALQREYYDDLNSLEDLAHKVKTYCDADSRKELDIIEWQAGALGMELVLPQDEVRTAVREVKDDIREHGLNRYGSEPETLVNEIARRFHSTQESAARRLMMLGEKKAGYALHLIDGNPIPYYRTTNWQPDRTYIISARDAIREFSRNEEFRKTVTSGGYIFVQNFFCRDYGRYVQKLKDRTVLTPYALNHIDECCLAFRIVFGAQDTGFDPDAMHLNRRVVKPYFPYEKMDDAGMGEALKAFVAKSQKSSSSFSDALSFHMKNRGYTCETLSEAIGCDTDTLKSYKSGRVKIKAPTLTAICVVLHLDPKFSKELFNKAEIILHEDQSEIDAACSFILGACYGKSLSSVDAILANAGYPSLLSM